MRFQNLSRIGLTFSAIGFGIIWSTGCLEKTDSEVTVYAALDREFSEPILDDLESELGYSIRAKYDQESNKTVGLATELIQSKRNPKADIFWNNEILHTLRLEKLGLLEPIKIDEAARFPANFRSPDNHWFGFAARARVLIVNTDLVPNADQRPSSIYDLADPKWAGRCAMARPVFGTTATHASVLLATLGEEQGMDLLKRIASNAEIQGGNKQVAQKVAAGQFAFGITDTDDAIIEVNRGEPVVIVFPDQDESQMGTLLIPNTLAVIKNGPNPERAKKLVARLLAQDVEQRLADGPSAQRPLASDMQTRWRVEEAWLGGATSAELKTFKVDFSAAAEMWDAHKASLEKLR